MNTHVLVIVLVGILACGVATASETLRCGNRLVSAGLTQVEILARCGEPASRETRAEPIRARRSNGTVATIGETRVEVWVYDRGYGKFPARLTFREGILRQIEFDK